MNDRMIMVAAALLSTAVLGLGSVAANAQQGAASAAQRSYRVSGFDSVSAAGPHKVVVTVGGAASVRAEGPSDVLDRMEVVVEDGDLEIRPKREFRDHYRWNDDRRATFYVTAPRLEAAAVAGSGDMRVDRVAGERFSGAIAGSGKLDVGSLQVSTAHLSIAGSGDLTARGSAARSELSIAGSGTLKLGQLASRTASVSIAGSGNADLNAGETVSVSIVGSGDVAVAGTARCSVTKMGVGRVRCAR
ncbi:MAG TPA: head GIN domain-containing protein [Allosphingosinicella sp.]